MIVTVTGELELSDNDLAEAEGNAVQAAQNLLGHTGLVVVEVDQHLGQV